MGVLHGGARAHALCLKWKPPAQSQDTSCSELLPRPDGEEGASQRRRWADEVLEMAQAF